jgi:hypothetical protein
MPVAALVRTLVTAYAGTNGGNEVRQTAWADTMEAIGSLLEREPMLSRVAAQIPTIAYRKVIRAKAREANVYRLVAVPAGDDQRAIDLDQRAGGARDPADLVAEAEQLAEQLVIADRLLERLRERNPRHALAFQTHVDGGGSADIIHELRRAGYETVSSDTANQYVSRARKSLQKMYEERDPS